MGPSQSSRLQLVEEAGNSDAACFKNVYVCGDATVLSTSIDALPQSDRISVRGLLTVVTTVGRMPRAYYRCMAGMRVVGVRANADFRAAVNGVCGYGAAIPAGKTSPRCRERPRR